jgi:hypothetical protein
MVGGFVSRRAAVKKNPTKQQVDDTPSKTTRQKEDRISKQRKHTNYFKQFAVQLLHRAPNE